MRGKATGTFCKEVTNYVYFFACETRTMQSPGKVSGLAEKSRCRSGGHQDAHTCKLKGHARRKALVMQITRRIWPPKGLQMEITALRGEDGGPG